MTLNGFKAAISTNGKDNASLAQSLQNFGQVDIQGSDFTVSRGSYGDGQLSLADVAKEFDDAWLGIAAYNSNKKKNAPSKVILTFRPSDGSIELKAKLSF